MKSVEPPTVPPEGEWRPSQVVDALPASSARGASARQSGGSYSLSNSPPANDRTRVFLHQLSQALTSLRGTLELALLVDCDEQEYRRAIQQSLGQAEELVQLFRSYRATAEAETNELTNEEVDLGELVRVALEELRPLADSRRLAVHLESGDGCLVQTDPARLLVALRRGLLCAIQHSPSGGKLEVAISSSANRAHLTIAAPPQRAESVSPPAFGKIPEHESTKGLGAETVEGDWTPARRAVEVLGGSVLTVATEASPLFCEICIPLCQP